MHAAHIMLLQQVPCIILLLCMHASSNYTILHTVSSRTCTGCTSDTGGDHPEPLRFLELLLVVPLLLPLVVVVWSTTGCYGSVDTQQYASSE
jgi:hypothetical protein